jgi:mRNA interferase MazF
VKGDVVVVPSVFRFNAKASGLVSWLRDLRCQITASIRDNYAIPLEDTDFQSGGLKQSSNIRPNRLFTADRHIVLYKVGQLKPEKMTEVVRKIVEIVQH